MLAMSYTTFCRNKKISFISILSLSGTQWDLEPIERLADKNVDKKISEKK